MKHPDIEDFIDAIVTVIREQNIEDAVKMEPVHSLTDILALRKITHLRKIARIFQVKYYSKKDRKTLTDDLVASMRQPELLAEVLDILPDQEWIFFLKAVHESGITVEYLSPEDYIAQQNIGLIQSFFHQDQLHLVVPDEIKAAFKVLEQNDYSEDRNYKMLMSNLCIAAINLYGVISQYDFLDLFNRYSKRQATLDELFNNLIVRVQQDVGFCFWDDYIVHDSFEDDDFELVNDLINDRAGKPKYEPAFDELLQYVDWNYYEQTPQIKALDNFFSKYMDNQAQRLMLMDEIHDLAASEARLQEYFDLIDSVGVEFKGEAEPMKLANLLVDVQNNTRLWRNHGHTPNELYRKETGLKNAGAEIIQFPANRTATKIGRNDPCPCGSGKKYKNCCGKS